MPDVSFLVGDILPDERPVGHPGGRGSGARRRGWCTIGAV